jgi:HlyD family secretion protein
VWGSVPTTVNGRGVLVRPRRIVSVQALGGGRLETLEVRVGDLVRKGAVLGRIDEAELRRKIRENRQFLETLRMQDSVLKANEEQQEKLQAQQDQLERHYLDAQRKNLEQSITDARGLKPLLERRVEVLTQLRREGLTPEVSAEQVSAETVRRDNDSKMSENTALLEQIDGQLKQIETRFGALVKQHLDAAIARQNQITDLVTQINLGELQLAKSGDIVSEYTGRVTEIFAAAGQVLPAGGRLLSMDIDDAVTQPLSISYFPVRDGKKVQPGMLIRVTPDTVEPERFGGILGKVISVSSLPVTKEGAVTTVGNPEVVGGLIGDGGYIEVAARLETDSSSFSGYRWSSSRGPNLKITPGLTTLSRVTVEGRAPITYLIPVLREATGVY